MESSEMRELILGGAETPECNSRITPYNTSERGSNVDIRTISEIFKRLTPKHLHGKKKFNFFPPRSLILWFLV